VIFADFLRQIFAGGRVQALKNAGLKTTFWCHQVSESHGVKISISCEPF
jgi:hypothetical protein